MKIWSTQGSSVFVSGYEAPMGWLSVLEIERMRVKVGKVKKSATVTEKLFVHESFKSEAAP